MTQQSPGKTSVAGPPPAPLGPSRLRTDNAVASWIAFSLPVGIVLFGAVILGIRWARLRRRTPPDPDGVLPGPVGRSLHEGGDLAATLGDLRTAPEKVRDPRPSGRLR